MPGFTSPVNIDQRSIVNGVTLNALTFIGWRVPAGYRVRGVRVTLQAVTNSQEAFCRVAAGADEMPPDDAAFQSMPRQFTAWRFPISGVTGDIQLPLDSPVDIVFDLDYYTGKQQIICVEYRFVTAGSVVAVIDASPGRAPSR